MTTSELPFDGAISKYFENECPEEIRHLIKTRERKQTLNPAFPYNRRLSNKEYNAIHDELQVELVKMLNWAVEMEKRVVIIFEGRDTAGKGGTIKRLTQSLNPRYARTVALSKPSAKERGQWYFQRYLANLPNRGEVTFFDRSWYNRAVIEPVFGFCTHQQKEQFFRQAPEIEQMLIEDGVILIKIWLTVGRAEQLQRFLDRESDPLKQWKLSTIDVKGLHLWHEYTVAIEEMFEKTHSDISPWHVIRSDDKKRARLAAMNLVLSKLDYTGKNNDIVRSPDSKIYGPPAAMGFEND